MTTLTVRVEPFARLEGVLTAGEQEVRGGVIALTPPDDVLENATLLASDDQALLSPRSVHSDPEGRFHFDQVIPGRDYALEAAHPEFTPYFTKALHLESGSTLRLEIAMEPGVHLSGRVLDRSGEILPGIPVHLFRAEEIPGVVRWQPESIVKTDGEGCFRTPALERSSRKRLTVWVHHGGTHDLIAHECIPPDAGTRDLGDLRPRPGVVTFQLPSATPAAELSLVISALGSPADERFRVSEGDIAFPESGVLRIAGLPRGDVNFVVLDSRKAQKHRGRFLHEETDRWVRIESPPFTIPESDHERFELAVTMEVARELVSTLWVDRDGAIVVSKELPAGHDSRSATLSLPGGAYTVHLRVAGRVGKQQIEIGRGRSLTLSLRADSEGEEATLLVLRDVEPVSDADVFLRGAAPRFMAGTRVPWARSGTDGVARLTGLPAGCSGVTVTVMSDGSGRSLFISSDEFASKVVELRSGDR
ncbi:MAG: carboxypeptidase-like regulatory domain-containing protein [Planctomycetaceae bacterium]